MIRDEMMSRMSANEFFYWLALSEIDAQDADKPRGSGPYEAHSSEDQLALMKLIAQTRAAKKKKAEEKAKDGSPTRTRRTRKQTPRTR